ncbi:hypothetical protein H8356DRAFT_1340608 [Neocallimastix lanati (nom. inval.)]|nr:hypothetical protein H8356DRAFT_1340608 [Neocallimastix sp. JGI-2020a]
MDDQLEISETSKEKNKIIINRNYKFNLWYITNNTKLKNLNLKIILNDNNKVIKYENKHTHPGKEYDNEISEEIRLICSEYNSIKSQISRYIKKQLLPDISKFNEIPDES